MGAHKGASARRRVMTRESRSWVAKPIDYVGRYTWLDEPRTGETVQNLSPLLTISPYLRWTWDLKGVGGFEQLH